MGQHCARGAAAAAAADATAAAAAVPLMPRLLDISWVPSSIRIALDPRMCVKHTRERSEVAHRARKAASSVLGNGLQTVGAIGSVRHAGGERGEGCGARWHASKASMGVNVYV